MDTLANEIHGCVKITSSPEQQFSMIQKGHILIGNAKYKGKKVCLWLMKIPELEDVKCPRR